MHIGRTTTFRLTAALGVAFLCGMAVLLGLIYILTERELVSRTDDVLRHDAASFAHVPADRLAGRVRAVLADSASHLTFFALVSRDGRVLAGNFVPSRTVEPGRLLDLAAGPGDMPPLRVLSLRYADGSLLVIGRDITPIEDLRHRVLAILITSGCATAVAVALAAVLLSIPPLKRIRRLTSLAGRIAAGDLGLRMPVTARGDELDVIAATINAMVEEIARLLDEVKNATDAIAHDLRTPLARARSRLEAIRRQAAPRPPRSAYQTPEGAAEATERPAAPIRPCDAGSLDGFSETLDAAVAELDVVLTRFTALLRIAELEAANRKAGFGSLDPMTLAADVCELYGPLAEERGVHLRLSGEWGHVVRGDAGLLFEAVSNLVENAIKFIDAGGGVMVSVSAVGSSMTLSVRDNGPGIPPEERASVLRRFYRSTAARHVPGSGLGLSLVAAIVHLHGFALDLVDAAPGLDVRISGPIDDAAPARIPS